MLPERESKTRTAKPGKSLRNAPALFRYAVATGFALAALGIGCLAEPMLGHRSPMLFFVAASLSAGWLGGFGPGLLAMVEGFLLGDFFFVPPLYRFGNYSASDFALLMTYSFVTAIGLAAISNLHQAQQREEHARQWNKELERRVRERTAELEVFCHSISHDLRAPIRTTTSFSQLLQEDYAACFDEKGRNLLRTIIQSNLRMDQLLNDMLRLSRLSRKEMQWRTVNLSGLAQSIVQNFQRIEPQRNVSVIIAPNLAALGDEALLHIALENLLNNAWKFTGKNSNALVEFGSAEEQGQRFYFVRDNGVGFDMAFAAKIFGVFERLHPESEFPGTGIGLALVQRIVNRHEGQIWARAAPNQGATFCFTLPGPG